VNGVGSTLYHRDQENDKEKKSKKCNSEIILISDQLDGSFLDIEYKEGKLKISIHIHIIK
ncbi:hypothetical protein AC249_AIPGENE7986, partial [Exaiptasia diaphana]